MESMPSIWSITGHATIFGIPVEVKELKLYITNAEDCMKETTVRVENRQVKVYLPAVSFVIIYRMSL